MFIVLAVFLSVMLFIPDVNALEFDNVKSVKNTYGYLEKYKDININNVFGLGKTLWTGSLTSNTDSCGIECQAIQTITLHEKGSLVDEIIFKTLQEDKWIEQPIRKYQIYYWGDVQDYEIECVNGDYIEVNKTYAQICSRVESGTHKGWIKYELGTELAAGTYEVKLEGEKKPSRTVDWIYKTQGVTLNDWAVWGSIGGGDEAEVVLNSPEDESVALTNEVQFNATANVTGGATLTNISLWHNGTGTWHRNQTEVNALTTTESAHGIAMTSTSDPETGDSGIRFNLTENANLTSVRKITTGTATRALLLDASKATLTTASFVGHVATFNYELIAGTTYYITADNSGGNYGMKYNGSMSYPIVKGRVTFTGGMQQTGVDNPTHIYMIEAINTTKNQLTPTQTFNSTITSPTLWTYEACDSDGDCGFATENRTVFIDADAPNIIINLPTALEDYGISGGNETLNWTITDSNLDSVWFDYNGTNTTLNGAINSTTFNISTSPFNLTLWANDTVGNYNSSYLEWEYKIFNNNETYNSSTYETASETYSINVTANSSLTAANLIWNGTSYAGTQSGNVWSKTFDIPIGNTTKDFYWNFTYGEDSINSTAITQTITALNFTLCGGAGGSVAFLNFTFKDESDDSAITNGTIPTSSFNYWLGSGSVNKTTTLINNTGNPSYAFCSSAAARNITVDYTIQYEDQEGDYIQRLLNPDAISFSNTTTDTVLYLLKSTDGIYVTFQVINVAEQPIEGVIVTGTRILDSETTTVASGTTDSAGAVTFFLDSDFQHTFLFEGTGYDDYTTNLYPTQSSYTVILGLGSTIPTDDYNKAISYTINPTNTSLENDTAYDFQFILDSDYWNVDSFGFILYNSSGDMVDSDTKNANGGTSTTNYNVGDVTSYIIMKYFWEINGSYTNGTTSWYVLSSAGTEWSIKTFFDDFGNYTESGMFGMGDFAKSILVFLIVFMFVGIMSYRYGLVSSAGVASLAFGLVMFFNYLDLIPNPVSAVPYFPTVFMGLVLLAVMIKEVFR